MSKLDQLARDALAMLRLPRIVQERIRFELHKPELGHCWAVREGWNSGDGYAKCRHNGAAWFVHRLAYVFAWGSIERKKLLDHLCRNRACIRPSHLEPVTNEVNTKRGEAVLFKRMA